MWTLGLGSLGYLGMTYGLLGATLGNLGSSWGHLGAILRGLEGCLGHPGAILGLSWENMGATWVQDHLAKILKSLSLGACAVKTLACQHTSAHATPCKMENVDFTMVL